MIYGKEDIMLEATYESDIASILCTSDMLINNFCEFMESATSDEMYVESAGKVFDSLKATIHKLFTRVSEFTRTQLDKLDTVIHKEKYKKMMSPEMQKMLAKAESGKTVKCPDFVKAKQLLEKMQNFTEKFKSQVAAMIPKATENPGKWSDKFSAFADKSKAEFKKLKDQLDNVLNNAKDMRPADVIKMIKNGIDIKDVGSKFQAKLDQFASELTGALDKVDSIISAKTGVDVKGELGKLKAIVTKAANTVVEFASDHARGISTISAKIALAFAAIGVVNNTAGIISGDPKFTKNAGVALIGSLAASGVSRKAAKKADINDKLSSRKVALSGVQAEIDN